MNIRDKQLFGKGKYLKDFCNRYIAELSFLLLYGGLVTLIFHIIRYNTIPSEYAQSLKRKFKIVYEFIFTHQLRST